MPKKLPERVEVLERAVDQALFRLNFLAHQIGSLRIQVLQLGHELSELTGDIELISNSLASLARTVAAMQKRGR